VARYRSIKLLFPGLIFFAFSGCALFDSSRNATTPAVSGVTVNNAIVVVPENERLLHAFKAEGFNADISAKGVVVYIPGLFFEVGSSELMFEAKEKIRFLATVVQRDFVANRKLAVMGHTDSTGDASLNMALSRRRAEKVMDELIFSAVHPDRIDISWFGETRPVASNKNASGRSRNRRVEFVVLNL